MSEPLVCCIMLTKDRPKLAARAVRSFSEQTYFNKTLLVVNSGLSPLFEETDRLREPCFVGIDALSIGGLRNHANRYAATNYAESCMRPDILIHWDDDDWSRPNRIAKQVALLQASGADAVGYNEMLFWREPHAEAWRFRHEMNNYCLGTSLCYWRKTWERKPFPDKAGTGRGEDYDWIQGMNTKAVSAVLPNPMMIASIHPDNARFYDQSLERSTSWTLVPQWDEHCRKVMAL